MEMEMDVGELAWERAVAQEKCMRDAKTAIMAGDLAALKKNLDQGWHPSLPNPRDHGSWFAMALSGPSGQVMGWMLDAFPLAAKLDPVFSPSSRDSASASDWRAEPMLVAERFAVKALRLEWLAKCWEAREAGAYFEKTLADSAHWRSWGKHVLFAQCLLRLFPHKSGRARMIGESEGRVRARAACIAFVRREILEGKLPKDGAQELRAEVIADIRSLHQEKKSWAHYQPLLSCMGEDWSMAELPQLVLPSRESHGRERAAALVEMVNGKGRSFFGKEWQDFAAPIPAGAIGAMALFGSSMDCFEEGLRQGWIGPMRARSDVLVDHPRHLAWREARLTQEGGRVARMDGRWAKCESHIKSASLSDEDRSELLGMCERRDPAAWSAGQPQELVLSKEGWASPLAFLVAACAAAKIPDEQSRLEAKVMRLFSEGHRLLDGILDDDVCSALNGRPWLVALREREILGALAPAGAGASKGPRGRL